MILLEQYWSNDVFRYSGVEIPRHFLNYCTHVTTDSDGIVKAHSERPNFNHNTQTWSSYGDKLVAKVDLNGLDPEMTLKEIRYK